MSLQAKECVISIAKNDLYSKRDDMVAAIQAAQKGNLDEAVEHLKSAQEYIDDIVRSL